MENKISVTMVDDHRLFRQGLSLLLSSIPEIDNISEFDSGEDFLQFLEKETPDLVFMDIHLPGMDGIHVTKTALEKTSTLKIIALSMYEDQEYYYQMIEAGAKGFLVKSSPFDEVKKAIETVISGDNYFSKELLCNLIRHFRHIPQKENQPQNYLSEREKEILTLICKGFSSQEIADALFISKRTVESHRANILTKTNCKNTANLVIFSVKNKLIDLDYV